MLDWKDFDSVFQPKKDYTPDHKQGEAAIRHRKELGGHLYFDLIWTSLGLKQPSKIYPPKTNQDLRNIWSKVVQSEEAPDVQKLALLYYISRDCRQVGNADAIFARTVHLPPAYQLFVTGLWELDHCQFARALEHLTDPSLPLTYADEILLTLLQHPKCDPSLAMAYYVTVSPPLRNQQTLDAYFKLLLRTSVVEAYHFAKRQPIAKHRMLFEELILSIHQEEPSPARAERATLLVGMPFTEDEEAWFEDYLLHGKGATCHGAKDSVVMRRVATGRSLSDVKELDRLREENLGGIGWDNVKAELASAIPT